MATATQPSDFSLRKAQVCDTKIYAKSTGGEEPLTNLRSSIGDEMADEILQCTLKDFLDHYAPWRVPVATVDNVYALYTPDNTHNPPLVKRMVQDHEDTPPDDWVFASFETEPRKEKIPEAAVFQKLKNIVDSLQERKVKWKLAKIGRAPTLCYKDSPYKNMTSEIKGTNVRMDAYMTERRDRDCQDPNAKQVNLADVAVAAEFKKHVKARAQNRHQLVANVSQVLNNDPRRTWMYAFTIENTMMSVWHFSRSHTAVSVPFDFTKDIRSFIHVFLSLIYATREEIGYDPTIHRVLDNGEICYVYEVDFNGQKQYFKTLETLFALRVLCITGRKTRVWRAVEVEGYEDGQYGADKERGGEVVLKDYWLDHQSKTEKSILDDIFGRLEEVKQDQTLLEWMDPPHRQRFQALLDTEDYKEYFMDIKADMQLATTKSRLTSAEPVPDFFSPPESIRASHGHTELRSAQTTQSLLDMANTQRKAAQDRLESPVPREYRPKRHCRLIYEKIGRPLYAATHLRSTFDALFDTLIALTLLYLAGYVHRDVSIGNIIMVEKADGSTGGKLSDLEYAKVFQAGEPSADPKTGVPFFMAYEIHNEKALYCPPTQQNSASYTVSTSNPGVSDILERALERPCFRFTHDLESLLWADLYFPTKYLPGGKGRPIFHKIYVASKSPSQMRQFLVTTDKDSFRLLLQSHLNPDIALLIAHLARYQNAIKSSYMDTDNVGHMSNPKSYFPLYNTCLRAFSDIRSAFDSGQIPDLDFSGVTVAQQQNSQPEIQRKRSRAQEDDVEELEDQPARKQPRED